MASISILKRIQLHRFDQTSLAAILKADVNPLELLETDGIVNVSLLILGFLTEDVNLEIPGE